MSSKHKQQVNESFFAKAGSYDDTMPTYDWMKIANGEQKVAPISAEDKQKQDAQLHEIEQLYPKFHTESVSLTKLIPAKEEWNFFPNQDNTILTELMKNLVAYGQLSPAIVWKQINGTYMILGGHTRFKAFTALYDIFTTGETANEEQAERFSAMNCYVYDYEELDETEARKIIIFDNMIRRDNTTSLKAQAVINMNRLELDSRKNTVKKNVHRSRIVSSIAKVMGTSKSSVSRLYQLRNLISEFWPLMDGKGDFRITTQTAIAFASLPEDLQQYIYTGRLYQEKLSGAQLKRLSVCTTTEEIDDVYLAPKTYTTTSKIELKEPLPENYTILSVPVSSEELPKVREEIKELILNMDNVSDKTKKLLSVILK